MGGTVTFRFPAASTESYRTILSDAADAERVIDERIRDIDLSGDTNDRVAALGIQQDIELRIHVRQIAQILLSASVRPDVVANTTETIHRAVNSIFHPEVAGDNNA